MDSFFFLPAVLSIAVLFSYKYLTSGLDFFLNAERKPRIKFLLFLVGIQSSISILISFTIYFLFENDNLQEYKDIMLPCILIIGTAPFNITALIWLALGLEAMGFMKRRYGDKFKEDIFDLNSNKLFKQEGDDKVNSHDKEKIKDDDVNRHRETHNNRDRE